MAPETHVPCTHACVFYFIIELLIFYSRSQCNTKDFELVCDLINLIFPYKIFRLIHFIKFAICRQCTFPTTFLWKIHNFFLKETGQNFDKMHSILDILILVGVKCQFMFLHYNSDIFEINWYILCYIMSLSHKVCIYDAFITLNSSHT